MSGIIRDKPPCPVVVPGHDQGRAMAEINELNDRTERRDDAGDRLESLYGLTPKVESAIITAVDEGVDYRARALVGPLHPADQADLIERLPTRKAEILIKMLGSHLDPEMLSYLDESTAMRSSMSSVSKSWPASFLPCQLMTQSILSRSWSRTRLTTCWQPCLLKTGCWLPKACPFPRILLAE